MTGTSTPRKRVAKKAASEPKPSEETSEGLRLVLSISEATDNLTGYDDDAIREAFDAEVWEDVAFYQAADGLSTPTVRLLRMLTFVRFIRAGQEPDAAFDAAKALSFKQLANGFLEQAEPFPDEPTTAAGKDDSAPA